MPQYYKRYILKLDKLLLPKNYVYYKPFFKKKDYVYYPKKRYDLIDLTEKSMLILSELYQK